MRYKPGTLSDYTGSMAEKMRTVFEYLWKEQFGHDLPPETTLERRLLFVAIAQGVIQHLQSNSSDAFDIEIDDGIIDADVRVNILTTGELL